MNATLFLALVGMLVAIAGGIGGIEDGFRWGSIVFSCGLAAAWLFGIAKSKDPLRELDPDSDGSGASNSSLPKMESELRRKDRGNIKRAKGER